MSFLEDFKGQAINKKATITALIISVAAITFLVDWIYPAITLSSKFILLFPLI